jgi:anti-sigma-K factor RskA
MNSHDDMLDNVAAYALGTLLPGEAAKIAQHLQTCEACREEYRFLQPAVTAVAYSAEAGAGATAVSPLLKARIMKQVRAEVPARSSVPRAWGAYALAAACLALAIVTGLADISLNDRLARAREQSAAQVQTLADLAAPDAQRYAFADGAVVTAGDRLYLTMRNLPAPPAGHVYQAWTLPKGSKTMAPSSTFTPENGGVTVLRLPAQATAVTAVAVSVEPEGGSKQPTTKPIAVVRI